MGRATSTSFDPVAHLYDETRQLPSSQMDPLVDALHTELSAYDRVLEIGVGTGRFAMPLQERGLDVVGVDISPQMLARGRAKGLHNGVLANALHLPIEDDAMDAAYGVHVLQFIEDWRGALGEIVRVSRHAYYTITTRSEGESPALVYWRSIRDGIGRLFGLVNRRGGLLTGPAAAARKAYYEVANFWSAHRSPTGLYWHYLQKAATLPDVLGIQEAEFRHVLPPDEAIPIGTFVVRCPTADAIEALREKAWSPQWGVPEQAHRRAMDEVTQGSFGETTRTTSQTELLRWDIDKLADFAAQSPAEAGRRDEAVGIPDG